MTVFNSNFLFLDNPHGGVENLADMKAAGFEGVFCNVHSSSVEEWEAVVRPRARVLSMFCGPWARMGPDGINFNISMLDRLITIADRWEAPLVVNAEAELKNSAARLTAIIAAKLGNRDAAIIMEPWLFNPPSVDWNPVAHIPMLLEIFPVEQPLVFPPGSNIMKLATACKVHAHDMGIKCVYFTFGTYGRQEPSDYKLQAPYSLYLGDTMASNYSPWSPTSTGFKACQEVLPPVTDSWYSKPYKKGTAVGPPKLPRVLKVDTNVMSGDDILAMKRTVSHAQRWLPWAPTQWDKRYSLPFAMGKGTGNVGESGVKGFQRQEGLPQTGIIDDATYQRMRRALIPVGPREGSPILDSISIGLINAAIKELSPEGKLVKIRATISDFCERAEVSENLWHYTQNRPYTGLGIAPERNHENDCSSYVILAYWWARQITGLMIPDPSGYRYSGYGNTWDDLDGHPRVTTGNYLVGDLAHYDGHVTICRKPGNATTSVWSSFGQEWGPEALQLYYRDLLKVVRPPLLP